MDAITDVSFASPNSSAAADNPYKDKPISKIYPNLGVALAQAGMPRPIDIARYLENTLGLTSASAVSAASKFLNGYINKGDPLETKAGRAILEHPKINRELAVSGRSHEAAVVVHADEKQKPAAAVTVPASAPAVSGAPPVAAAQAREREFNIVPNSGIIVPLPLHSVKVSLSVIDAPAPVTAPAVPVIPAAPVYDKSAAPPGGNSAVPPSPPSNPPAEIFSQAGKLAARATPSARPLPVKRVGHNYFEEKYKGHRLDQRAWDAGVNLTRELSAGGVRSYAHLLELAQKKQFRLNVTNNTIKRLQAHAKEFGFNEELQAGRFQAGITTMSTGTKKDHAASARRDFLGAVAESFNTRPPPAPVAVQAPEPRAQDFAAVNLARLSTHDASRLARFMKRLEEVEGIKPYINGREAGKDIDPQGLENVSIRTALRPRHGQTDADADRAVRAIEQMGIITRASGTYMLTAAFARRFSETFDWYKKGDGARHARFESSGTLHLRR